MSFVYRRAWDEDFIDNGDGARCPSEECKTDDYDDDDAYLLTLPLRRLCTDIQESVETRNTSQSPSQLIQRISSQAEPRSARRGRLEHILTRLLGLKRQEVEAVRSGERSSEGMITMI